MVKAIRSEPASVSGRGTVDQGAYGPVWGRPGGAGGWGMDRRCVVASLRLRRPRGRAAGA